MSTVIMICGLPGSGKTTLAKKLASLYGTEKCNHYNADEVRAAFNDWDFSDEGRLRQAKRMSNLCLSSDKMLTICDFVAPTKSIRSLVPASYTIWMDTIAEGRFADTNKVFEPATEVDLIVKTFDYDIDFINNQILRLVIHNNCY